MRAFSAPQLTLAERRRAPAHVHQNGARPCGLNVPLAVEIVDISRIPPRRNSGRGLLVDTCAQISRSAEFYQHCASEGWTLGRSMAGHARRREFPGRCAKREAPWQDAAT